MRFLEEELKPDLSVDIVHLMCPIHLLELNEAIKQIEPGQILELVTDYERALEDVPKWCEVFGQEFIGLREDGEIYKFYIRRKI
ncbi:SirA family protein [Caldimicrobium thiodismutans]|jgi:TusA-related sulfurtransferase|uniref:SirA family protein n=1 Tax=Caldimicrobium thiodismutans TaxID=1653476 RepID=A0A0U4W489_9BACT|nr:sulfurtransferase TusA family protein [Caldimicrobium thiodismutans]BAU23899.1 SirA family protein [Caldimicrobium thiodismutans]